MHTASRGSVPAKAASAVERACRFLAAAQHADGFWRDYALPPGASTAWVSAVVGFALAGVPSDLASGEALRRGLAALRSDCRRTGWGYNAAVATDADSTSWVLRCFVRAGVEPPVEPVVCLEAYVGPEGGARTFVSGLRYGRWTMEHADVTAVLGLAMREAGAPCAAYERARRWALARRNGDGLWSSFWWSFDAYATAHTLALLAATGGIPRDVFATARRYVERCAGGATAMETAHLSMIASHVGCHADAWASRLLDGQRADGAWPPSCVLKVPDQHHASGDVPVFEDGHALMSTSMAVVALTELLRSGDDRT